MWSPRTIAKLVNITLITLVYDTCNYSRPGMVFKNQYITGGHHIVGYNLWLFNRLREATVHLVRCETGYDLLFEMGIYWGY